MNDESDVPVQEPASDDHQQQQQLSAKKEDDVFDAGIRTMEEMNVICENVNSQIQDFIKSSEVLDTGEVNKVSSSSSQTENKNVAEEQDNCMDVDESVIVTSRNIDNDTIIEKEKEEEEGEKEKQEEKEEEQRKVEERESSVEIEEPKEKEKTIDLDEKSQTEGKADGQEYQMLHYEWTATKLVCKASREFKPTESCENFTKACHWSPDGTCTLVPSEDFRIRIFELPRSLYSGVLPADFQTLEIDSSLKVKEGGTVYDTCWFPYMNSWDPSTCCFLSTSQGSPVHLWDAFTGELRATYRAYNLVDEVEAAISLQFTDLGGRIWSGFKNALRIFDTDRPGRQIKNIFLKKDFPNITGLVSCIRENPEMPGLIAFGTYSKGIGIYKDGPICTFRTGSGVTQIEFSPCGTKLYSTVRRDGEFLCWDLRNPGTVLYSLGGRQSNTNQRIWFNLSYNGEEIVSGGTDGGVRVWKIPSDVQVDEDIFPTYNIKVSKDCVNGVSLHKNLPILAVTTGERKCDDEENTIFRDNSLRLYWLNTR